MIKDTKQIGKKKAAKCGLIIMSLKYFKKAPNLIMQIIGLSLFLLANHNFFTFYYVSFAAMWIQYQIYKFKNEPIVKDTLLQQ